MTRPQLMRIRYGFRLLVFAVTTCAVAFAVLARSESHVLDFLASSVLAFWLGFACMVAGGLEGLERAIPSSPLCFLLLGFTVSLVGAAGALSGALLAVINVLGF